MAIKTTFNIKLSQVMKINQVLACVDYSKSYIINTLFKKVFKSNSFKIHFLQSVKYQESIDDNDKWKHCHVSLDGDVYEKCLDMRKLFKLSVSFIISYAIDRYLDELLEELNKEDISDNYSPNYILLYTKCEFHTQISLIWGILEAEELNKLYKLHVTP